MRILILNFIFQIFIHIIVSFFKTLLYMQLILDLSKSEMVNTSPIYFLLPWDPFWKWNQYTSHKGLEKHIAYVTTDIKDNKLLQERLIVLLMKRESYLPWTLECYWCIAITKAGMEYQMHKYSSYPSFRMKILHQQVPTNAIAIESCKAESRPSRDIVKLYGLVCSQNNSDKCFSLL